MIYANRVKKKIIIFDDESCKVLEAQKNQSEYVRQAVKYMSMDITPDTIEGLRLSYSQIARMLKDIDSKLDYLARSK
jgi:hypothetical protein